MFRHSLASLAVVVITASAAGAQTTTIKLATQAPTISSYNKALADLGAEWEAKTSGRVKMTIWTPMAMAISQRSRKRTALNPSSDPPVSKPIASPISTPGHNTIETAPLQRATNRADPVW